MLNEYLLNKNPIWTIIEQNKIAENSFSQKEETRSKKSCFKLVYLINTTISERGNSVQQDPHFNKSADGMSKSNVLF